MLTAWDTSDHTDFSESTEAIAPLTEEEKKARLEELRQKLKEKKANQAVTDKEDATLNEVRTAPSLPPLPPLNLTSSHLYGPERNTHMSCDQKIRQKATRDTQDAKEELERKEQLKQAAKKRQEKQDDMDAKKRVRAKIEADKAERRRKAEQEKAAREGRATETSAPAPPAAAPAAAAPKKTVDHTEARLKLQTSEGAVMKTLPAETTLFELAQVVEQEKGVAVTSFSMTFPRKTFEGAIDYGKTLKEAGLVPSAVLNVK